jgi:hypothetical protein
MIQRVQALRSKHFRHVKFGEPPMDRHDFGQIFDLLRDLEISLYDKKIIPAAHWRHLSIKLDRHFLHGEGALTPVDIEGLFDAIEVLNDQMNQG